MKYKDYFIDILLPRVKMLNCLKVFACYMVNLTHHYDDLIRMTDLEKDDLDDVMNRLMKRGMLTKLGRLYQIGGSCGADSHDPVFDICKKFNCNCKTVYHQAKQKDASPAIKKQENKSGYSIVKRSGGGTYMDLLILFYTLIGGRSPNTKRDLSCLTELSKNYSMAEIEAAIRYAADKRKIYTISLLPYMMNEALAKSDVKTKDEVKPLSKQERIQLCYEVLGEDGVKKQFGDEELNKFLGLLNSGKIHLGLKERIYQK